MAVEVIIPSLGEVVEEVTIIKWLKNEGDPVEKGESLLEVESEKVTTEIEAPASGIVGRILYPEGATVPITFVAAVLVAKGEPVPEKYVKSIPEVSATPQETASIPRKKMPDIRVAPAARKLARMKDVDLSRVTPTGPHDTIMKKDVETYLSSMSQPDTAASISRQTAEPGDEKTIKASTLAYRYAEKEGVPLADVQGTGVRGRIMRPDVERAVKDAKAPKLGKVMAMDTKRQVIARRMSESAFTAPHIYLFMDIYLNPLLEFRKMIITDFDEKFGERPSVNDFLIKAVALNIVDFPILNAVLKEDEIYIQPQINIGLAVSLPNGLVVPAIVQADRAGLSDIVRQRVDLVSRARAGRLKREELERGTFTITSLSQYDITCFTAIINPPQSGILSVAKARDALYLDQGVVKTRKVATFGLSVDHRVIDGAVAADFMQHLKAKLENPTFTFLDA